MTGQELKKQVTDLIDKGIVTGQHDFAKKTEISYRTLHSLFDSKTVKAKYLKLINAAGFATPETYGNEPGADLLKQMMHGQEIDNKWLRDQNTTLKAQISNMQKEIDLLRAIIQKGLEKDHVYFDARKAGITSLKA